MKKINATFTKKQKLVRQQKQSETVWSEMETLVVVLSLKVRKGSNEDWISPLVSFIGVKNVKGVSRIWGKRMEIKVAEINAPLNLMKRKLSATRSPSWAPGATQFKNGNALPFVAIIGFDREPLSRQARIWTFDDWFAFWLHFSLRVLIDVTLIYS